MTEAQGLISLRFIMSREPKTIRGTFMLDGEMDSVSVVPADGWFPGYDRWFEMDPHSKQDFVDRAIRDGWVQCATCGCTGFANGQTCPVCDGQGYQAVQIDPRAKLLRYRVGGLSRGGGQGGGLNMRG